jgi:hypothetical protein
MPELLAIQREFAQALDDAAAPAPPRCLAGDPALIERRLAIYRANVAAAATKALASAYPVLHQVIGAPRFERLSSLYQHEHPSTGGDLTDFGAALEAFVAGLAELQALPYLPALARLEWAVHRAHGAADAPACDRQALAQVPPARQPAIRFAWAAGTALVAATFPIVRIWQIHQPGHGADFDVDWSVRECALVARDGFRVAVDAVAAADAAFIQASLAGAPLGTCTERALAADPGFALGDLLARCLAANLICGFNVEEDQEA